VRPRDTVYRLASSPKDFSAARKLSGAESTLSFPTVVAERDSQIIGCIGTHRQNDAVVAGFFRAPTFITAMRLVEACENVLRLAGVREYLFALDDSAPRAWLDSVERSPELVWPVGEVDGVKWYRRKVMGYEPQESKGA